MRGTVTEEIQDHVDEPTSVRRVSASPGSQLQVGLLTGGQDRHYAVGLATALVHANVTLDVIGSDSVDGPEMHCTPGLRFLKLHGTMSGRKTAVKLRIMAATYVRLIRYAATARSKVLHILWNNKIQIFDRTLLMLYYKFLGKKVVLTAHNINADRRDAKDSFVNRLTLMIQYRLADHIFVHTKKMKDELLHRFHVRNGAVTIIPYGINNAVPDTKLTQAEARSRLGIGDGEKVLLFFGAIKRYKGLEYLVPAFFQLAGTDPDYRLIIAGERKKGNEEYLIRIQQRIAQNPARDRITQQIKFVPDEETEIYFKAADAAILPYTEIFQSGILFLAYSFGLPVIASDVGSFREDVLEGRTGLICKPCDSDSLAAAIGTYFHSDLYRRRTEWRREIKDRALSMHSWQTVADLTRSVYQSLVRR